MAISEAFQGQPSKKYSKWCFAKVLHPEFLGLVLHLGFRGVLQKMVLWGLKKPYAPQSLITDRSAVSIKKP